MSEEELRNRWMAAMLSFDWSKEKVSQENTNNNEINNIGEKLCK